jgi:UPF0755 protein
VRPEYSVPEPRQSPPPHDDPHGQDGPDGQYDRHGQYDPQGPYDPEGEYDDYDDDYYEDDSHEQGPSRQDYVAARRRGGQRGSGGRRRHPILVALLVGIALILTLAIGGFVWANGQINPGGHPGPAVSVQIPSGSSTSKIASILSRAGVIHEATLFTVYARISGTGTLYPGSYSLNKNLSYKAAIAVLEAGPKIVSEKLVIPEGFTVRQIANAVAALPQLHLSAQKFLSLVSSGQVRSPYEPTGTNNLEGLLFPATYVVDQGQTESGVLEQMISAFDIRAQQVGLTSAAAALHMTPYQVVTVASIVEREAKIVDDRGPVASVIYNRLRAGMTLGADSTQTYYLRLSDPAVVPTVTQLNQPSPYNTRLNTGLPPTPIANPGLPSLQAAAAPPSTTYLYFVEINPDGKLGYASTSAGFSQLQAQCQAASTC